MIKFVAVAITRPALFVYNPLETAQIAEYKSRTSLRLK
jgi:hypothetical protein